MVTQNMLKLVNPNWHAEFLRYIKSGEASTEFLNYLDNDADCDRAVDLAVEAMVRGLAEQPSEVSATPEPKRRTDPRPSSRQWMHGAAPRHLR